MSRIDRIPLENRISLEQSIEAYRLAGHSNACHSFKDLLLSGTWQKYEARAASLARKHPSRDPLLSYLAIEAGEGWNTANSRQSYRSALARLAARDILELVPIHWRQVITEEAGGSDDRHLIRQLEPHIDENARNRMKEAWKPLSSDRLCQLSRAVDFILQVPPDPHHTALRRRAAGPQKKDGTGASPPPASKKTALQALCRHQRRKAKTSPDYDWRSHFWTRAVLPDAHLGDHRRACIAALMLTGCRPSEFCDDLGVTVRNRVEGNRFSLHFEIMGAKVSDEVEGHAGKGQERRAITLICRTVEARWLFDHVARREGGRALLQLPVASHTQTGEALMPSERHRRVSVSLGKLITRLGRIAFPRLRHKLTPYVFRHAFTADFKAGGHDLETPDLAAALGHQSARTQEHYGNANAARGLAGSRAQQVIQVRSALPVRQPVRPPVWQIQAPTVRSDPIERPRALLPLRRRVMFCRHPARQPVTSVKVV